MSLFSGPISLSGRCYMSLSGGGLLTPSPLPPDSILNLCVFPSHREGLGMGFHNRMGGMGGRGRGQCLRWLEPK